MSAAEQQQAAPAASGGGGGGGGAERFDALILAALKTPIKLVHPRAANRTKTMWDGAVSVRVSDPITTAFETLVNENILSAPVVDAEGRCCGFIDMADLVFFVVGLYGGPSQGSLSEFFEKSRRFREAKVVDVMEMSDKPQWRPFAISKTFSLYHALETLAKTGVHRLAVVGKNDHVQGIITESMAIGWLSINLSRMGRERSQPISSFLKSYSVVAVNENEQVMNAFKLMVDHRLSGLAVVDNEGQLVDSLSVRDLKGIGPDAELFVRLWDTVRDFKAKVRKTPHGKTIPRAPVYVTLDDSFGKLIELMEREAVHRVFVVRSEGNRHPITVVSQSDVLKWILP